MLDWVPSVPLLNFPFKRRRSDFNSFQLQVYIAKLGVKFAPPDGLVAPSRVQPCTPMNLSAPWKLENAIKAQTI